MLINLGCSFLLIQCNDGFDGAPFVEEASEGRVKHMDLTVPQYGLKVGFCLYVVGVVVAVVFLLLLLPLLLLGSCCCCCCD